ncbi:mediator of RNA polymerase II transcription subunit 15a-like [Forsythia ovata]|uniref:Mediator of RNA polymerase II transcription subunit 15a-like n=1 Tax=Forsythia ovata TaxID=205694 RepID=A0ABD1SMM8_9LAMI
MKHHEPFNARKHSGQMTSEKSLQQVSRPMQIRQSLETPSDAETSGVQPKLLTSAFPRSQNPMLVDQQKPVEQSQTALPGLLQVLESTSQFMLTNSAEWVDPVFKQIQLMNSMYLSEVFKQYKRALESGRQATNAESATRSEKTQVFFGKIMQFLQISKTDLMHCPKENVYQLINEIVLNLKRCRTKNPVPLQHHQQPKASSNPSRTPSVQQNGNIFQFNQVNPFHNNTPTSVPQLLMQQGNINLRGSSMNQFHVGSSTGMQKSDPSSLMNSLQYSLMKSRQQYSPSRAQQGMSLPQKGSQIGFEHRASGLLPRSSAGIAQHNTTLSTQQMGTSSLGNTFNNLDFAIMPLTQNPIVTASQHNRRQEQHLTMQKKLKHPMQQMLTERNKQQMVQKMNEDAKMAQFAGFNQRMLAKPHSSGQHLEQYPWALLQSSSTPYRVASPQSSQHSSTQLELKDLSSKLSRSTTTLLSTASPSAVPSPLTPVTPSSVPTDQEKIPICFNPISVEERNKVTKAPIEPSLLQSRGISEKEVPVSVTHELSKSPLLTESTCPVDYQQSHAKADPVQRLVEVVKSMSRKALHASVRDINAVTCIIDRKPGSLLQGGSRWVVGQDLVDDTRSCEQGDFDLLYGTGMKTRMKRHLCTISADDTTSSFCSSDTFESGQTSEVEFNSTSRMKRLKKQPNDLLLEEIREINHKLIETVVDVVDVKDVSLAGSAEGTVIRCLYNAVQCNGNGKMLTASSQMFSNLLVELFVTADYPNSSPIVLERLTPGCSEAEEVKVMWTKAKSKFSLLLRKFSQPISIKEMAKTWDVCAREVFREFVQNFGGGDFSSTYGKWENCVVAT